MDERQVVVCSNCQIDLSNPVVIDPSVRQMFEFRDIDPRKLEKGSCCPVSTGKAITIERGYWSDQSPEVRRSSECLRIWLNPDDMLPHLSLDLKLAHGCCGPSGEVNLRCSCGALIGRHYGDCMGAHHFSPDPTVTEWIPFLENPQDRELNRYQRLIEANRRRKHARNRNG